jgi:hypothetical protein
VFQLPKYDPVDPQNNDSGLSTMSFFNPTKWHSCQVIDKTTRELTLLARPELAGLNATLCPRKDLLIVVCIFAV